jgi:hypothetical protein
MVKFVHENDDREYIKVIKRKNLEGFKQLVSVCIPFGIINYSNCSFFFFWYYEQGLKILFVTVAPDINTIV